MYRLVSLLSWRFALAAAGLVAAIVVATSAASASSKPSSTASSRPSSTASSGSLSPVSSKPSSSGSASPTGSPATAKTDTRRPNIVFVLTDDLSMNLLQYMPQVKAMQQEGISYDNYFVTDSLCCPSRSSIFTGDLPHDTGVFTNSGSDGGIGAFYGHGDETSAFSVHLQRAGYRTAMMGKYLNGYMSKQSPVPDTYVPPGWDQWDVTGPGYDEYNYPLNEDGTLHRYGHAPKDYLVDVMAHKGAGFVRRTAKTGKPFFLELATFAPHAPYTPAPRYAHSFPGLQAPKSPAYDVLPTDAPSWLAGHQPLDPRQQNAINLAYRKRVQDVQGVDDMINRIEHALRVTHQLKNTYLVFSSDNGYHMGEYRLMPGKQTAFDTDIHVPLVIDGPGVPAGATSSAMAQNTDLAPTFEQIAGTSAPCDGHSLLETMSSGSVTPPDWRNAALVEHHGPDLDFKHDPDAQSYPNGDPTTYEAMRGSDFTYVEYRDGEREYYDLRSDPYELHNVYAGLPTSLRVRLHAQLARMERCHGARACWAAGHVAGDP